VTALLRPLFALTVWAQQATQEAGTTGEGAAQAFDRLDDIGSATLCGVGHDRQGSLLPLFDWTAWAETATVEAGTTGEGAALSSVRFIVVGTDRHNGGGHGR
jgi:hypothetical protein